MFCITSQTPTGFTEKLLQTGIAPQATRKLVLIGYTPCLLHTLYRVNTQEVHFCHPISTVKQSILYWGIAGIFKRDGDGIRIRVPNVPSC